jgi:hypothetical protein
MIFEWDSLRLLMVAQRELPHVLEDVKNTQGQRPGIEKTEQKEYEEEN